MTSLPACPIDACNLVAVFRQRLRGGALEDGERESERECKQAKHRNPSQGCGMRGASRRSPPDGAINAYAAGRCKVCAQYFARRCRVACGLIGVVDLDNIVRFERHCPHVHQIRQMDPPDGGVAQNDRAVRAGQVREANGHKIVSYGTSSYGYDIRCSTNSRSSRTSTRPIVDPKLSTRDRSSTSEGDVCIIPPNSFALARTVNTSAFRATC
jgi:hypothetical protein